MSDIGQTQSGVTMTAVMITKAHGRTEFKCRYDASVVALIKDIVPHQHRDYDRETRIWVVDDLYAEELIEALCQAGHMVGDTDIPAQPKTFWNTDEPGEYAFRKAAEVMQDIPPDQRGAVFRAMARILYPDMYGR